MSRQTVLATAYLVWFAVASVLMALALALAFEDRSIGLWFPFAVAYLSLVRGASFWFCQRAREIQGKGIRNPA